MKLWSILGNSQKLDGGAMFGNAPRALWSRWTSVDEYNRIDLACRALLASPLNGKTVLFETGIGAFFEPALRERYGVDLPYEEQRDWGITVLERDAIVHCVEESHSDENILAGVPYDDAVETVRAWHEAGHFIHITSHRAADCQPWTAAWLDRIGLPYDELYCSYDKVSHCRAIGIELLIDDSPVNLEAAVDAVFAAEEAAGVVAKTPVPFFPAIPDEATDLIESCCIPRLCDEFRARERRI